LLARPIAKLSFSSTNFVNIDHSNEPSLKLDAEAVSLASNPLMRVVSKPTADFLPLRRERRHCQHSAGVTIGLNLERTHHVRGVCGPQQQTSGRHSTRGDRNKGLVAAYNALCQDEVQKFELNYSPPFWRVTFGPEAG
jgi:hypothetical protein